jgi:hypothetical protein
MFSTGRSFLVLASATVHLLLTPSGFSQIQPNGQPCDGDCNGQLPACQNTWQPYISAVFLGRATEVRKEDVPIMLDGEKKRTEKLLVTFAVEEAFVGVSEKVVTVSSGGDMCAFPFSKGHEYLVYSRRLPSGELYVSTCYGTEFAESAPDALKYLRGLPDAPHGGTIFGTALRFTEPLGGEFYLRRVVPEVGHKVKISGNVQNFETVVDNNGSFAIQGLPPGQYTVSLDTTGEVYAAPPAKSTVEVADKGCARFNFRIDPYALETSAFRCPLPPGFPLVKADRQGKRLFLEASENAVRSQATVAAYLIKLGRVLRDCEPSWNDNWSASFFLDPKLAGYKTDTSLAPTVENGDWGKAYIAEYDRVTQTLTIFPLDPQKRQTRKVIVSR